MHLVYSKRTTRDVISRQSSLSKQNIVTKLQFHENSEYLEIGKWVILQEHYEEDIQIFVLYASCGDNYDTHDKPRGGKWINRLGVHVAIAYDFVFSSNIVYKMPDFGTNYDKIVIGCVVQANELLACITKKDKTI